jgi:hypothetical protein
LFSADTLEFDGLRLADVVGSRDSARRLGTPALEARQPATVRGLGSRATESGLLRATSRRRQLACMTSADPRDREVRKNMRLPASAWRTIRLASDLCAP